VYETIVLYIDCFLIFWYFFIKKKVQIKIASASKKNMLKSFENQEGKLTITKKLKETILYKIEKV